MKSACIPAVQNKDWFRSKVTTITDIPDVEMDLYRDPASTMSTNCSKKLHRHRPFSRLSSDGQISQPPFNDDLLDDLPFCPESSPMDEDLSCYEAQTSTPFMTFSQTLDLFNKKLLQQDIPLSLSKVSLNQSRDSGRWSIDTQEADDIRSFSSTSLPRLSLEKSFDKIYMEDILHGDSAYESGVSEHATDLASLSSRSISEKSLTIISTPEQTISDLPESANEPPPVDLPATDERKDLKTPTVLIKTILKQFSPVEPDRLIGRRIGRDFVDIVGELRSHNMNTVLSSVLKHVETKDLFSMSCVSQSWKEACDNDKKASARRLDAIEKRRLRLEELQQENVTLRRSPRKKRGLTKSTALNIQAQVEECRVITRQSRQLMWQEGANRLLRDQELRKCHQCQHPAQTLVGQERAICINCAYDFCLNCQCTFHGSSPCSFILSKKVKTDIGVATHKSKKNLRRLSHLN